MYNSKYCIPFQIYFMPRTIAYLRKSSEDETEKQAASLERQLADIKKYVSDFNSTHSDEEKLYIDFEKEIVIEDRSAKKLWREQFDKMMDKIEKGRYEVLLCTELSRLSRNPIDTWRIVNVLDNDKLVCIRTLTNVFYNNPTDKFTFSLFLAVAKYENDQRWKNTSSWMRYKQSQWWTTNLAPMWYRNAGTKKWERYIERDWDNFTKLQELWGYFTTWKYKVSEIYKMWCDLEITRIKSFKWDLWTPIRVTPTINSYRDMFSNPYFRWVIITEDWEVKWKHEPMVDDEIYERAQIVLQKNWFKHSEVKDTKYENILKEILLCWKSSESVHVDIKLRYTCPICKNRFFSNIEKSCTNENCKNPFDNKTWKIESFKYYVFPKWHEHTYKWKWQEKKARNIPTDVIENLIDAELSKISISEDLFLILKRMLFTLWNEKMEIKEKEKNEIKNKITKLEEKKKNTLSNLYSIESIDTKDKTTLLEIIQDIKREMETLGDELQEKNDDLDERFEIAWESPNTLLETKKVFWNKEITSLEPKRKLLLSLVSNHKFLDWKIITEWREPFGIIYNAKLTKQKSQVDPEISDLNVLWLPVENRYKTDSYSLLKPYLENPKFLNSLNCKLIDEIHGLFFGKVKVSEFA